MFVSNNIIQEKMKDKLPELKTFLKGIEPISSKDFPVCCQDSSIILFVWLQKKGVNCKIMAGDYEDPVISGNSFHFWIETETMIIDGTAVQFLLSDYDRPRKFSEIEELIPQTDFFFKKTKKQYKNKVNAYICDWLQAFTEYMIDNTSDVFDEFINQMRVYFDENNEELTRAKKFMMISSLCKNNMLYYDLNLEQFLDKCYNYKTGIIDAAEFINKEYVFQA